MVDGRYNNLCVVHNIMQVKVHLRWR